MARSVVTVFPQRHIQSGLDLDARRRTSTNLTIVVTHTEIEVPQRTKNWQHVILARSKHKVR